MNFPGMVQAFQWVNYFFSVLHSASSEHSSNVVPPLGRPQDVKPVGKSWASALGLWHAPESSPPVSAHIACPLLQGDKVWRLLRETFPDHLTPFSPFLLGFSPQLLTPSYILCFSLIYQFLVSVHTKNASSIWAESLGVLGVHYCTLVPRIKKACRKPSFSLQYFLKDVCFISSPDWFHLCFKTRFHSIANYYFQTSLQLAVLIMMMKIIIIITMSYILLWITILIKACLHASVSLFKPQFHPVK